MDCLEKFCKAKLLFPLTLDIMTKVLVLHPLRATTYFDCRLLSVTYTLGEVGIHNPSLFTCDLRDLDYYSEDLHVFSQAHEWVMWTFLAEDTSPDISILFSRKVGF